MCLVTILPKIVSAKYIFLRESNPFILSLGLLFVNFKSFMEIIINCLTHFPTFWYQVFPIIVHLYWWLRGNIIHIISLLICSNLITEFPQSISEKFTSKLTGFHVPDSINLFFFSLYHIKSGWQYRSLGPGGALWEHHFLDTKKQCLEEILVK